MEIIQTTYDTRIELKAPEGFRITRWQAGEAPETYESWAELSMPPDTDTSPYRIIAQEEHDRLKGEPKGEM